MKLEHLDAEYDFDTEFSSLTNLTLTYFNPQSLSIMDLQKEFEMAVQDEDLVKVESEKEEEEEDMAVITTVEEPEMQSTQVKTPLTSPIKIRIPTKQRIETSVTVGY